MNEPGGIKSSEEDTVPAAPLRNWHLNDTHHADHGDATYPRITHEDKASLLLPDTSIRGALRSRCSRIARSIVSDSEGFDELTITENVHKQLAADPLLVCYLFGTTEYRGVVRAHDCEGQVPEDMGRDKPLKLTRNAIDRVTESAAHGALYSELLYSYTTWDPTEVKIDYAQLCRNTCQDPDNCALSIVSVSDQECERPAIKNRLRAAILFLTVAVTGLCKGVLPLRGGTGGGSGFIEVSCVRVNGLPDDISPVEILFEAADHPESPRKTCETQVNFARDILTRILTVFTEDDDEATSTEQRVINLVRQRAGLKLGDDRESPIPSCFRPTTVRIGWNSLMGVFVYDPQANDGNTQYPSRAKTADSNGKNSTAPLPLPDTSIRDALRSGYPWIARTVLYTNNPPSQVESFTQADSDGNQVPVDIHEQLTKEPRLVHHMSDTTEYRGTVRVRDCTTKDTRPSITVTHNAIDRRTGGVVEGFLFNEMTYSHVTWNDIVIEVDTARLLQNVRTKSGIDGPSLDGRLPFIRASWYLSCIVLVELSAGTLPLGGRMTRNHGQVEVMNLNVADANGQVINTPPEELLWKRDDSSKNDTRGGTTALLAYLRNRTEKESSYEDRAERLQKFEEPADGASTPDESDEQ